MNYKIYDEVDCIESDYKKPIDIIDGLPFSQTRVIKMVEFYSNSKYLNGDKDEIGRSKPFYNIVNYRTTLAKVATDFDTKDMQLESDNPDHRVRAMILQHELYEWMKDENFAYVLNKFGYYRAKYGGAMVKTTISTDEDGEEELCSDVIEWKNVAVDQIDIKCGPKIEYHFMNPVELMEKDGDWDNVREVIKLGKGSKKKKGIYGDMNYASSRITIKEVNGIFSKAVLKDAKGEKIEEEDEWVYSRQKYFIFGDAKKQIILYAEEEDNDIYDYLPWEEMSGRGLGRGVMEDSEEAQVWINDGILNEKRATDLGSKAVIVTDSKQVQNNILTVDNGKIFKIKQGERMDVMSITPSALGQLNNQIERWESQANRATSSFDAVTGEQPPANTPYSQTALLNQIASKPLDYRREEAGIFWSKYVLERVIPFLVKNLGDHILVSDYSEKELEVIDSSFAKFNANKRAMELINKGKIVTQEQYDNYIELFTTELKNTGNKRYIQIPDGYFDDIEVKVSVITTNETRDKLSVLQSLSQILRDVSQTYDPASGTFAMLDNPVLAEIFGKILEISGAGISPASLGIGLNKSNKTPQPSQQPQISAPIQNNPVVNQPQPVV